MSKETREITEAMFDRDADGFIAQIERELDAERTKISGIDCVRYRKEVLRIITDKLQYAKDYSGPAAVLLLRAIDEEVRKLPTAVKRPER